MSRPKTGSVTALAVSGQNGTRLLPQQDRLPGRPRRTRRWSARRGRATTTRTIRAIGVRSGMSSASNVTRARLVRGLPATAAAAACRPAGPPRSADRTGRGTTRRSRRRRRHEPTGQPQVAEEDDQGDDGRAEEQAELGAEPGPEHRVEADALVPQRVGPQVEAER